MVRAGKVREDLWYRLAVFPCYLGARAKTNLGLERKLADFSQKQRAAVGAFEPAWPRLIGIAPACHYVQPEIVFQGYRKRLHERGTCQNRARFRTDPAKRSLVPMAFA
jgi:hypothetical protein